MAFIDATVVTIALPPLQADLDATFQAVQWVELILDVLSQ
jgi:hypothetical protein